MQQFNRSVRIHCTSSCVDETPVRDQASASCVECRNELTGSFARPATVKRANDEAVRRRREDDSELWSLNSARLCILVSSMPSMDHSASAPSISREILIEVKYHGTDLHHRLNAAGT
jgi:hypothetical protein